MFETFKSDSYPDGMTKQGFKDETDINRLLEKAHAGDSLSHLVRYGATYGDFSDIDDLLSAHARLERATEIFEELPAELKREFHQSPQEFYTFVNDPANKSDLALKLPVLAREGNQRPDIGKARLVRESSEEAAHRKQEAIKELTADMPNSPEGSATPNE